MTLSGPPPWTAFALSWPNMRLRRAFSSARPAGSSPRAVGADEYGLHRRHAADDLGDGRRDTHDGESDSDNGFGRALMPRAAARSRRISGKPTPGASVRRRAGDRKSTRLN